MDGLRDQLVGRFVQERDGKARYEAEWEVAECQVRTPGP
jgi:hypothetical protein